MLADGPHTVYATDTDGSGSTSPESNTNTFTVTTSVAPPSITSPADGTLTNHTSMTVLISGVGNGDGSLSVNGTVYNFSFDVTGHAQVDRAGPLADGACTLKATQEDTLGNSSDLSAPVSFTVKTSIGAPTVLTPADGTLTNERTPTVTLTADAGTTDTVYIDGARRHPAEQSRVVARRVDRRRRPRQRLRRLEHEHEHGGLDRAARPDCHHPGRRLDLP